MGTWGTGTFDNDTAADWAAGLADADDLTAVEEAIDRVLDEDEYLDSDDAVPAIVACEVIARLQGRWGERTPYSEGVDTWVAAHPQAPSDALVARAVRALDRILEDDSELPELWADSGDDEAWRATIADLRQRVSAPT